MGKEQISVGILGIGSSVPEKVINNYDLEKMVDTTDEWIIKRTGIEERRILEKDQPAYVLGINAANKALADAGVKAEEIDMVIVTTCTPDYLTPTTACIIQKEIGADRAAAFDMNAACSGFVYGLTVGQQFIQSGNCKYVLVVAVEALSKFVDWEDRNTCILFGDGAGAAVLGRVDEGYGILSTHLGADGSGMKTITLPCGFTDEEDLSKRPHDNKQVLWMDGSEVFKFAVRTMEEATLAALQKAGLEVGDVDLLVPHQANVRIVDGAQKRLGIAKDKVVSNLKNYGNTSSASIPLALDEVVKKGMVEKGHNIVLVGFGGGLTWASAVIRWAK